MRYNKDVKLKNGQVLKLRNGTKDDGEVVLNAFNQALQETDFLRIYLDENRYDVEKEKQMLDKKTQSENKIEIVAFLEGRVAGFAGIDPVADVDKLSHRATFGIAVLKEFWHLGIGTHLTQACIECAKEAKYTQIELDVVSDNKAAINLYKKFGFVEFGRNPRGFRLRNGQYKELVYMLLDL